MKFYFAVLSLFIFSSATLAELIPIEHFAKHAKYEDIIISPTGEYLAVTMRNEEGRRMIAILRTEDMKVTSYLPPGGKQEPFNPTWVNNERIVAQLSERWGDLDSPRGNGELIAMNANGKKRKMLTEHQRAYVTSGTKDNSRPKNKLQGYSEIIHSLPKASKHVLIEYYAFSNSRAHKDKKPSAYRLNIFNGKVRRIAVAPSYWAKFITDADGNITHSAGFNENDELEVHKLNDSEWELLDSIANLGDNIELIASISGSSRVIIKKTSDTGPNTYEPFSSQEMN